MKKIIFLNLFIFISLLIYSNVLTIKDTDIFDFINEYKKTNTFNKNNNYLWTGTITEIIENNNVSEVKIIKSRWINKKEIESVNITLKVNNKEILERIKRIGVKNKIVFVTSIESITKDLEIICIPVLIKEL